MGCRVQTDMLVPRLVQKWCPDWCRPPPPHLTPGGGVLSPKDCVQGLPLLHTVPPLLHNSCGATVPSPQPPPTLSISSLSSSLLPVLTNVPGLLPPTAALLPPAPAALRAAAAAAEDGPAPLAAAGLLLLLLALPSSRRPEPWKAINFGSSGSASSSPAAAAPPVLEGPASPPAAAASGCSGAAGCRVGSL